MSNQRHRASYLVLTCVDFRFQETVHDFLIKQGIKGQYDLVCLAGASKNIVDPTKSCDFETLFHELRICSDLHKTQEFWIIDHEDCGAYGGSSAFGSYENELKVHRDNLAKSREIVKEEFPQLEFKTFFARLNGTVESL